jgi:hypothetical protein
MKRNKHYQVILAWMEGASIEFYNPTLMDTWAASSTPMWADDVFYRVSPNVVAHIEQEIDRLTGELEAAYTLLDIINKA